MELPPPPKKIKNLETKYLLLKHLYVMLLIVFLFSVVVLGNIEMERVAKIRMYGINASYFTDSTPGYYDPNGDFYCVWTKYYSDNTTKKIEQHEKCHMLAHHFPQYFCSQDEYYNGYEYCYEMINEDYDHFCHITGDE